MKKCNRCKAEKPLDEFSRDKNNKDGLLRECKTCNRERANKWNLENPDKVQGRRYTRHGITKQQFDAMLSSQGGKCNVCETDLVRGMIDHDHNCCPGTYSCGKCIRGILCNNCNTALGMIGDNPKVLARLIEYLDR